MIHLRGNKMRTLFFVGTLLAMGYVAYLQMRHVKENDLDQANNRIEHVQDKVNKLVDGYGKRLDENMP